MKNSSSLLRRIALATTTVRKHQRHELERLAWPDRAQRVVADDKSVIDFHVDALRQTVALTTTILARLSIEPVAARAAPTPSRELNWPEEDWKA